MKKNIFEKKSEFRCDRILNQLFIGAVVRVVGASFSTRLAHELSETRTGAVAERLRYRSRSLHIASLAAHTTLNTYKPMEINIERSPQH